jgi:hypothetical protein
MSNIWIKLKLWGLLKVINCTMVKLTMKNFNDRSRNSSQKSSNYSSNSNSRSGGFGQRNSSGGDRGGYQSRDNRDDRGERKSFGASASFGKGNFSKPSFGSDDRNSDRGGDRGGYQSRGGYDSKPSYSRDSGSRDNRDSSYSRGGSDRGGYESREPKFKVDSWGSKSNFKSSMFEGKSDKKSSYREGKREDKDVKTPNYELDHTYLKKSIKALETRIETLELVINTLLEVDAEELASLEGLDGEDFDNDDEIEIITPEELQAMLKSEQIAEEAIPIPAKVKKTKKTTVADTAEVAVELTTIEDADEEVVTEIKKVRKPRTIKKK